MKKNFSEDSVTKKSDVWLAADEMVGIPPLPNTTAGIHYRAKKQGWKSRKREGIKGGKAIEYDLYSLPEPERNALLFSLHTSHRVKPTQPIRQQGALELSTVQKLMAIFNLMTESERLKAIDLFKKNGLKGLMPAIIDEHDQVESDRDILYSNQTESSDYQLSQSSINTAKILDKLTAEQRREILRRYDIDEGDNQDTINQTVTQYKKEAG